MTAFAPGLALCLRNMTALDAAGLHAISVLARRLRESGRTLLLCGARDQPQALIAESFPADDGAGKTFCPTWMPRSPGQKPNVPPATGHRSGSGQRKGYEDFAALAAISPKT